MTQFDTAVLFDVENLLGDPTHWKQAAAELSFGDIIESIHRDGRGAELVREFAVSRAYGNWGDSSMRTLRREMTENGVEPRQIFAYDPAGMKNAADIELVIDALDLAYSRPGIRTFVIVTGDGGFASLVRKLHELGKAVVVCAGERCSGALRAVADLFVELPRPAEGLVAERRPAPAPAGPGGEGQRRLDEARTQVLRELEALAARRPELVRDGLLLQTVGQHFSRAIPALGLVRAEYPGLREFLQWACAESPFCVIRRRSDPEGSQYRVARRLERPPDAEVLPAYERRPPRDTRHTVELYQQLASQGKPYVRLVHPEAIALVLATLAERGVEDEELSTVIDEVANRLDGVATAEDVKFTVLAVAHSEALVGQPRDAPMQDRRFRFVAGPPTAASLRRSLLDTVRLKLRSRVGQVDEDVLGLLIAG